MVDWYTSIKYIGTIALIIPIIFLFRFPFTLTLYIIGLFFNIFLNFIVKREEKTISEYDKKHKKLSNLKKTPFYEYDLYAFPSEKNQNISYAVGFMVTYLAQNREKMESNDLRIISIMILSFYLIIIIVSVIIYLSHHNNIHSILTGHVFGVLLGVTFFKLSEPMLALKSI